MRHCWEPCTSCLTMAVAAAVEGGEEMEVEEAGEAGVDGSRNLHAARVVEEATRKKTKRTRRCVE